MILVQREAEFLPFARLETCQEKMLIGKDFLLTFQVNVQRSSNNEHNKKTVIPAVQRLSSIVYHSTCIWRKCFECLLQFYFKYMIFITFQRTECAQRLSSPHAEELGRLAAGT